MITQQLPVSPTQPISCFELPFTAQPQYVTIRLTGTEYIFRLQYNVINNCWVMDIGDTSGNAIANGIPLVTGADLFQQFEYLGFGGQLLCYTDHQLGLPPSWAGLGTTGHTIFIP